MALDAHVVNCGSCGLLLDEDTSTPSKIRSPCPACGSVTRSIHVSVHETLTVRERLGMKGRHANGGKPFIEQVHGADLHRDTGRWRELSRVIDRGKDLYHEVIKDPATGEVLHECKEPLSEHRGHGAAKRNVDESEDGEQGREGGRR
jgi:hypothetical protein